MGHCRAQRGDQHSIDIASKMPKRCQSTGGQASGDNERPRTQGIDDANCVVYPNILEEIGVLRNTVIKTVGYAMVRHSMECFLGTTLAGWHWRLGRGGSSKGPATHQD